MMFRLRAVDYNLLYKNVHISRQQRMSFRGTTACQTNIRWKKFFPLEYKTESISESRHSVEIVMRSFRLTSNRVHAHLPHPRSVPSHFWPKRKLLLLNTNTYYISHMLEWRLHFCLESVRRKAGQTMF